MTSNQSECRTTAKIVGLGVGAVAALAAAWLTGRQAFDRNLVRFAFGDHSITTVDHRKVAWDFAFILCYGLFFLFCAWIFRNLAISGFGRLLARIVIAGVAITVLADVVEDAALWFMAGRTWLGDVPGVAATVKWSALLVAVMSVPAAGVVLLRLLLSNVCFARRTRDPATGEPWWNSVLADAPPPAFDDPAVKLKVIREQSSWAKAYRVPGANDILNAQDRRGEPVTAICLSGGGVRSACVAMGATQEFAKDGHRQGMNLLDNVDYVISVSGGGYTSGARLLATQPENQGPTLVPAREMGQRASEDDDRSPARSVDQSGLIKLSERYSEGSLEFDYFRRHSSYIADSPSGLVRALAVVLKNLVASLVALFWVPVAVGFAAGLFYAWQPVAAFVPVPASAGSTATPGYVLSSVGNDAAWWAVVVFVGAAVAFQILALLAEWWRATKSSERWRERCAVLASGMALFAAITLAVTVVIPALMRLGTTWFLELPTSGRVGGIAGVVGLQYLASVAAMIWKKKSAVAGGATTHWVKRLPRAVFQFTMVVLTLAVLAALWLIVFGAVAAHVFKYAIEPGGNVTDVPGWQKWLLVLGAVGLMLGIADVTSLSLHPFYRGRLARTFAVRRLQIKGMQRWKAERYAAGEGTWLDSYGTVKTAIRQGLPGTRPTVPKFVFAAAVPISGDEKPAPGLNAVSFVLTADYVGGPELGWLKTPELIRVSPPRVRRDLTVQAAVAISGAAFASSMGRQSSWVSTLLAVSGARLGTWLPNPFFVRRLADGARSTVGVGQAAADGIHTPDRDMIRADIESANSAAAERKEDAAGSGLKVWPKGLPTMRASSYFYRELLGLHKKDGRLVQVTDGGHYENLGLVEALRRRCRLIYCIDSSGDTPPLVTGLADAIRLAEYELGITITPRDSDYDDGDHSDGDVYQYTLTNLAPGSGAPFTDRDGFASLNARVTRQAVVVADITYPDAAGLDERRRRGVLIVAKAVLWRDCPPWLLTYAAAKENEIFPHDPTSDQWFNEAQFSAYSELGRLIGKRAITVGAKEYAKMIGPVVAADRNGFAHVGAPV